jgi:hypothetical protein
MGQQVRHDLSDNSKYVGNWFLWLF